MFFVDATHGQDMNPGSQTKPWRSLGHAVRQLKAGNTLQLRGGTYFENVRVAVQGTATAPITIRSYPGELAVLDGGIKEFQVTPQSAWEKSPDGPTDEYQSAVSYPNIRDVVGHLEKSMVALQTYANLQDLRAANEIWEEIPGADVKPVYVGPGMLYDAATGKLRIRLAHTNVPGIRTNYRGSVDPRQLSMVIAPFRSIPLHLDGAKNIRLQNLVIRGGGYDTVVLEACQDVEMENVFIRAGTYGMRVANTQRFRFIKSAIRGNNPPWGFRTENGLRNRPGANKRDLTRLTNHALLVSDTGREYSVYALPANNDWEIAESEFTDCHDGLYLGGIGVRFHHNLVENCHDDGIYLSPVYPHASGEIQIYGNVFRDCLTALAFGAEMPVTKDKIFIYRNVFDLRGEVLYQRPTPAKPQGVLETSGAMGDHGSPPWPEMNIYHNTFLVKNPRQAMMGLESDATGGNPRRVFNNLFLSENTLPPYAASGAGTKLVEDGNLFWGRQMRGNAAVYFDSFRSSAAFDASKLLYLAGNSSHSLVADPQITEELTLPPGSPAINAGVAIPAEWPDHLREQDQQAPDIGALPQGVSGLKERHSNPAREQAGRMTSDIVVLEKKKF